eukprot:1160277-Pelagomonas_calceolata.AAC.18
MWDGTQVVGEESSLAVYRWRDREEVCSAADRVHLNPIDAPAFVALGPQQLSLLGIKPSDAALENDYEGVSVCLSRRCSCLCGPGATAAVAAGFAAAAAPTEANRSYRQQLCHRPAQSSGCCAHAGVRNECATKPAAEPSPHRHRSASR